MGDDINAIAQQNGLLHLSVTSHTRTMYNESAWVLMHPQRCAFHSRFARLTSFSDVRWRNDVTSFGHERSPLCTMVQNVGWWCTTQVGGALHIFIYEVVHNTQTQTNRLAWSRYTNQEMQEVKTLIEFLSLWTMKLFCNFPCSSIEKDKVLSPA